MCFPAVIPGGALDEVPRGNQAAGQGGVGWCVLLTPQLSTLALGLGGHGPKEVETRSEHRLIPVHSPWAHLAHSAQGSQEALAMGEGWPRTPSDHPLSLDH